MNIYFDCEPERQDELKQAVLDTINDLKNNKISEDEVTKLKEAYVRNKETNLFENDWWIYRLEAALVFTYEPLTIAKDSTTVPSNSITSSFDKEIPPLTVYADCPLYAFPRDFPQQSSDFLICQIINSVYFCVLEHRQMLKLFSFRIILLSGFSVN